MAKFDENNYLEVRHILPVRRSQAFGQFIQIGSTVRISIKELFLIFPAFIVSVLIAMIVNVKLVSHWHVRALVDVDQLQMMAQMPEYNELFQSDRVDEINQWLASSLPLSLNLIEQEDNEYQRGMDPWGRSYHCVFNVKLHDGSVQPIGFYSAGEDGYSESNGNDPNDINSWDTKRGEFYLRRGKFRERKENCILGAMLTPVVFLGMLIVGRLAKSKS